MEAPRKPLQQTIQRRFLPFAIVGLLAPLVAAVPPQPDAWGLVWIAAGLTIAIAAVGVLVPWGRLPRWTYLLPPIAYFVVVALLRHASEGSVSGYEPLAILPVIWIALNLGRKEVALGVVAGSSIFVVPLLVGDPETYGSGEWRRAILWTAVAGLVGFSVGSLMRSKRRQAREAEQRAAEIAAHERTLTRIVELVRGLTTSADTRTQICEAALDVSGASVAAIVEPDGTGYLRVTAEAGESMGRTRFRLDETAGSTVAFARGERLFTPDARESSVIPQDIVRSTGMVTGLCEPIQRDGRTVGVLAVGWPHQIDDVGAQATQAIVLLAAEAGSAIERADLLAQLDRQAQTDELTGLPNRRAWNEAIRKALAAADANGQPLCVAVIDLDRFKNYNDLHGHPAGDRGLKGAAAAWQGALRRGDVLARYGGDEFALALSDCGLEEAEAVVERLRALTPELTCSAGLACWDGLEDGLDLVARADAALYEAKRAGRDALVVAA